MTSIRNCIYTPNIGSRFAENYKSSIYEGEIQQTPQPAQSESSEPVDYIEKLKEIKSLLDAGIINEEDFEKMKQKIIDNMQCEKTTSSELRYDCAIICATTF